MKHMRIWNLSINYALASNFSLTNIEGSRKNFLRITLTYLYLSIEKKIEKDLYKLTLKVLKMMFEYNKSSK